MTNPNTIHVIESFATTFFGIVVELKHKLDGLPSGLIIKSETTGKEWKVKKRVLFYHTLDSQRKFTSESTTFVHASFASPEDHLSSIKGILGKEQQDIFEYRLQPIGHIEKPKIGDILVPVVDFKFACPCCGYKTFDHEPNGSYNICPTCFWEDDPVQLDDLDYGGGANPMSLREAQRNFIEFGACNREMLPNVRKPMLNEQRDANWKPFDKR